MKFVVDKTAAEKFKANMVELGEKIVNAISAAVNMAASMIESMARDSISAAGNFSGRWIGGLHVAADDTLDNMRISMSSDVPYAGIFETGGTIQGHPLLWLPLSGTDAEGIRASAYGGLFSAKYPRHSGKPLLFSIRDKRPKYFGTESVTLHARFHLNDDVERVMANFRQFYTDAMGT